MKNFYYLDKSGEVKGPFSSEQMRELNRSGQVLMATQVCEEGTENWIPYYQTAIGLPPRKQGPERIPKRKVQPKSKEWSPVKTLAGPIPTDVIQPKSKEWSPVTASSKNSSSINEGGGAILGGILGFLILVGGLINFFDDKGKEREKRAAEVSAKIASDRAFNEKKRKRVWSSRTILSVERLAGHHVDEKYQDQQTSFTPMIGVSGGRRIYGVAPTTKQIEKTRKKWIPIQYRVAYRADGGPVQIVTIDYDPSSYAR